MKYGDLNQKHPEYDAEKWARYEVLAGTADDMTDAWRRKLMPQKINEKPRRYQHRLRGAAYIGHFGAVVNYFASALFQRELVIKAAQQDRLDTTAYDRFAADADKKGNSLNLVLKKCFSIALVKQRSMLAVDLPPPPAKGNQPSSRYEEERMGLGQPYCYAMHPEEVIDWKYADDGSFQWCILKRVISERANPRANRSESLEEFKVWERVGGRAAWVTWRTGARRADAAKSTPCPEGLELEMHAEGSTSFDRIPLVPFTLPKELWIGGHVADINREHFARRSALVAAQDHALFPIPWIKLGNQIGGVGEGILPDIAGDQDRARNPQQRAADYGALELAEGDDIGFAAPDVGPYDSVDKQLKELEDTVRRVGHQMAQSVASTSSSMGRSGLSKQEDRHATEIVLKAYGKHVRNFGVRCYETVSAGRGDDVTWEAEGLDSFEVHDRATVLDELGAVSELTIPSPTFQREYTMRAVRLALPNAPAEQLATIAAEVEAAALLGPTDGAAGSAGGKPKAPPSNVKPLTGRIRRRETTRGSSNAARDEQLAETGQ